MKKLRLNPDELVVESFGLPEHHSPTGTVRAREGTDYTDCWGLCGEASVDGGISCGTCAESEMCTHDPYAEECVSYAVQCPFTENQGWSCGGSGCTQYDYTCRAGC